MARKGGNRFIPIPVNEIPSRSNNGDQGNMHIPQFLQQENPGSVLVAPLFNGNNYLPWSKATRRSLIAKDKLSYISEGIEALEKDSPTYVQWQRNDCMVTSWILNSKSKEFSEAFLYAEDAESMWKELEERFGGSNGTRLFQIKREINMLVQGNDLVMVYYTQLKRLWDELDLLKKMPNCQCGALMNCIYNVKKKLTEMKDEDQLIQFLMGLNESYEAVKSQILLMDPFPSLNKTYAMVLKIEKQKEVCIEQPIEIANFYAKFQPGFQCYGGIGRGRVTSRDDKQRKCSHCNSTNHTKETCFQLIGYPEWYPIEKRKSRDFQAHNVATDEDEDYKYLEQEERRGSSSVAGLSTQQFNQIGNEMCRIMKGKNVMESSITQAVAIEEEFTAFAGFSGTSNSKILNGLLTQGQHHICVHSYMFSKMLKR